MSSTIIFPNDNNNNNSTEEYSPIMKGTTTGKYEGINQLQQIIQFGHQRKHNDKGCEQCHVIAMYYRQALYELKLIHEVSEQRTLALVWEMTQMVLEHMETRTYHFLPWFDMMTRDLWQFAKWLKEKDEEKGYSYYYKQKDQNEKNVEHAIRITIYHCRACLYQQENNIIKARHYFRKCISLETAYEIQQLLQHSANTFLDQHKVDLVPSLSSHSLLSTRVNRQSSITSTTSSSSQSYASSTISSSSLSDHTSVSSNTAIVSPENACGNCGLEKKAMPVCAKCKTQRYCSAKCLKTHKPIHDTVCQK
ncbi:hypothetical protein BJ944DRAFT_274252 [Cunninghamella echinulata]|nr:hypothetical protein BJ944DRAFT_274252 [Cunninghamella echinulata]